MFSENDNYRKPKYFYFDEKGKFVFDAFFSSEYEDEVSGDSGDRVTGETDSENISSSTVNRDEPVTETDEKSADECQDNFAPILFLFFLQHLFFCISSIRFPFQKHFSIF